MPATSEPGQLLLADVWVELASLCRVALGGGRISLSGKGQSSAADLPGPFRLTLDRRSVVGDRLLRLALLEVGQSAIDIGLRQSRLRGDCRGVVRDRQLELAELTIAKPRLFNASEYLGSSAAPP